MKKFYDYLYEEFQEMPISNWSQYEDYLISKIKIGEIEKRMPKEFSKDYLIAEEEKRKITKIMLRELSAFIVLFYKSIK